MKVLIIFLVGVALNGLVLAAPVKVNTVGELGLGRHTRAVWSEGTNKSNLKTYVLESKDGTDGTVRDLGVSGDGLMPYITPDGKQIVYAVGTSWSGGKGTKDTYIIDWDGSNKKLLKTNASLVNLWLDPADDRIWVYYTDFVGNDQKPLKRFPIDNPSTVVTVLSNVGVGFGYFGSSWDEKWAFAATPTWGTTAVVDMTTEAVSTYGVGCETTMLGPIKDGSYYLLETAQLTHQTLKVYKLGNKTGVDLASPSIGKGDHNFGFASWATTQTDPRYIIARSPDNFNTTTANHLLMLRLNSTYDEIEAWKQISPNNHSPFASSVWIAESVTVGSNIAQRGAVSGTLPYRLLRSRPGHFGVEINAAGIHYVTLNGINGRRFDQHIGTGKTVYQFRGKTNVAGLYIVQIKVGGKTFSEKLLIGEK